MSYPWSDFSLKCGLCANRFGMYPKRFYKFFDDCINGVKINEVMSNMFPYGDYSRANMDSELICQCCYTQAVEMSRRDAKWVDCFKQMDAIKNQFSHLRGRDDFDYFLISTPSSSTSAPSTSFTGNQYRPTSAPSTSFTGNQYRPTFAPSTSFTGNQYRPTLAPSTSFTGNQYRPTLAPSTSFTGNQYRPNLAPSTSFTGNQYRSTLASSTSFTGNQYRPTLAPSTSFTGNQYRSTSASSTSFTGNQYRPTLAPSTSLTRNQYRPTSAPSTIVSGSTFNEDNSGNHPISSSPPTTLTRNQYCPTASAPSTIVSGSTHNEDNSDNSSTSESSTTVSENEYDEESSNLMASTHNTYINIMSNRVYSKSGAFYSCIIPSCKLFFKTFHKFKMHYRYHRNVNGLMCWTCIKILPNKSKMRKHKLKDSCKFPGMFVCVNCNESFNDLQSISHHKYIKHIKN